jgi:branched-chain amino acid transport system permease protein
MTALFCGAVVGSVVAMIVGIPALRIRGLFLAVATITFTVATGSYFLNPQDFTWIPAGRLPVRSMLFNKFDLETEHTWYFFCLAILGLVLLSMRSVRASRIGRVFLAVRENERGAQAFGVNILRTKLIAFAMSGFLAALAGGLLVLHQHARLTIQLGAEENLRLFLIAVVGGLGSATGVLVSVTLFQIVDFFVQSVDFRLLFNAVGVLIILVVYPSGLGGIVYDVRDGILRRIARSRGIHVPSLVADSREQQQHDAALSAAEHALEEHGVVPEELRRREPPVGADTLGGAR